MSNRGAIGVDRGKNPAGRAGLHVQAIGTRGTYGSIIETLRHLVGADVAYLWVLTDGHRPQINQDGWTCPRYEP